MTAAQCTVNTVKAIWCDKYRCNGDCEAKSHKPSDCVHMPEFLPQLQVKKWKIPVVIFEVLFFDLAQGRMNRAPIETLTHSCRFASLDCKPLHTRYTYSNSHQCINLMACKASSGLFRSLIVFAVVLIWNRKRPELALQTIGEMVFLSPSPSFLFLSLLSGCILFSCWIWWCPVKILLEFWFIPMLIIGWK